MGRKQKNEVLQRKSSIWGSNDNDVLDVVEISTILKYFNIYFDLGVPYSRMIKNDEDSEDNYQQSSVLYLVIIVVHFLAHAVMMIMNQLRFLFWVEVKVIFLYII